MDRAGGEEGADGARFCFISCARLDTGVGLSAVRSRRVSHARATSSPPTPFIEFRLAFSALVAIVGFVVVNESVDDTACATDRRGESLAGDRRRVLGDAALCDAPAGARDSAGTATGRAFRRHDPLPRLHGVRISALPNVRRSASATIPGGESADAGLFVHLSRLRRLRLRRRRDSALDGANGRSRGLGGRRARLVHRVLSPLVRQRVPGPRPGAVDARPNAKETPAITTTPVASPVASQRRRASQRRAFS
jgi:hypothetical protein